MILRGYFEKVSEVGVVATILGLKIGEVLELRFDLKQEVHHLFEWFCIITLPLQLCVGFWIIDFGKTDHGLGFSFSLTDDPKCLLDNLFFENVDLYFLICYINLNYN